MKTPEAGKATRTRYIQRDRKGNWVDAETGAPYVHDGKTPKQRARELNLGPHFSPQEYAQVADPFILPADNTTTDAERAVAEKWRKPVAEAEAATAAVREAYRRAKARLIAALRAQNALNSAPQPESGDGAPSNMTTIIRQRKAREKSEAEIKAAKDDFERVREDLGKAQVKENEVRTRRSHELVAAQFAFAMRNE